MEKLAIIVASSSSLSLMLAKHNSQGNFVVYDETRENVSLVEDFDGQGLMDMQASKMAMETLKMFRVICEVEKISNITAVATHSIKLVKNYRSFLDEVYNTCAFKFKVLSPEEEASLLYSGIVSSLDVVKGVVANIDADCTRFVQYSRRNIVNQATIPFGTHSIEQLIGKDVGFEEVCKKATQIFKKELAQVEWLNNVEGEFSFVGVGSAFEDCAFLSRRIHKYPLDLNHGYVVGKQEYDATLGFVKTLDFDKAKKIKGVESQSSNLMAIGICMIGAVMDVCGFEKLTISSKGIAEGILFTSTNPVATEKIPSDLLGLSLENNCVFFDDESNNHKQVSELAMILFRQLKVLHKLPRGYVKVLRIAAAMHDCGKRIKFYNHEKNSFNIILSADIFGCTHRELVLAAFVSASQNLSDFSLADWVRFKSLLLEEDLEAVRKLSLIVRLAEALDKTQRNVVQDVSCDILGDSVIMKTIVTTDSSIEVREAMKAAPDFKKIYKKSLEVL